MSTASISVPLTFQATVGCLFNERLCVLGHEHCFNISTFNVLAVSSVYEPLVMSTTSISLPLTFQPTVGCQFNERL